MKKRKTLLEQVEELRRKGFKIEYKKRKDRGIVIVSINDKKYSNKSGNAQVRKMTGEHLSLNVRKAINKRKREYKKKKLSESVVKKLRKVQRLRRERRKVNPKDATGTYTTKKLRENIEQFGSKEAKRRLDEAIRYERGIARRKNVEWMMIRIKEIEPKEGAYDKLKRLLSRNINKIKEEDVSTIYSVIYKIEEGIMSEDEGYKIINNLIKQ